MAVITERRLIALAFVLYCVTTGVMIWLHGMWLDELQPWCVARDSATLVDLYRNTRFEGHPPLWYLLLFGVSRLGSDPILMQALHVVIGISTAALVLWRAPFVWWWRSLIVFGYFFLYEYTVIARNYGLTLFLLLLAADVRLRIGIGWQWTTLLALVAFTHVWGIVFVGAWVVAELFRKHATIIWPWLCIVVGCCLFGFWWCLPHEPSPTGKPLGVTPFPNAVARIATITTQGMLPWPDLLSDRPWNHNVLHEHGHALSAVIGVVLLFLLVWSAPRDRSANVFLVLALLGSIGLPIIGGFYSTRHYGPVIIAWLLLWWIMPTAPRRQGARSLTTILLGCQVIGGLLCVAMSITHDPLSRARELPTLLQEHGLQDHPVVLDAYTTSPSVSGYLQRPIYRTTSGSMGSWCDGSLPEYVLGDTALMEALDRAPWDNFVWCTARPELRHRVAERLKAAVAMIGDLTRAQVASERITVFHVVRQ